MEHYLKEKRNEIIWALSEQDYSTAQIARMFSIERMTVKRIIDLKPADYEAKWVKK